MSVSVSRGEWHHVGSDGSWHLSTCPGGDLNTDAQRHRTVWAAVDAAGGLEADRVDRGKENLPTKVLMEPTLQEAQSPHVLLAVIWGTMCTICSLVLHCNPQNRAVDPTGRRNTSPRVFLSPPRSPWGIIK